MPDFLHKAHRLFVNNGDLRRRDFWRPANADSGSLRWKQGQPPALLGQAVRVFENVIVHDGGVLVFVFVGCDLQPPRRAFRLLLIRCSRFVARVVICSRSCVMALANAARKV